MLGIFALSAALKETDIDKYHASLALFEKKAIKYQKAGNLELKKEIFSKADYFTAGTVDQRLEALSELETKSFLSLKGGYGVQQCLDKLDPSLFSNSSIFAYSDLTALFVTLQEDQSIKLFHSPMLVELANLSEDEFESFKGFLLEPNDIKTKLLNLTTELETQLKNIDSCFINEPSYIWGGNLTLLLSTAKKPNVKAGYKKILFIEDCYEEAYKLERMLYSAQNQGLFSDIDELWLGESQEALFNTVLLEELAQRHKFKLVTGLPFGHKRKFTLPIFQYYD